jgi:hypothetical protein
MRGDWRVDLAYDPPAVFLSYIAMAPDLRGLGIGGPLLEFIWNGTRAANVYTGWGALRCAWYWTRQVFEGKKSGFVILTMSAKLAGALPDPALKRFALRLASLYLMQDVNSDAVYHDEVFLERPGIQRST